MFTIPEKPKSKWTHEALQRLAQENIDKAMSATPNNGVYIIGIFDGAVADLANDTEANTLARRLQNNAEADFRAKGYEIVAMRGMWCFGVK